MITALDIFSGASGGWSLGLHRAGVRTVAACEIDDWRNAVFAANNPGVKMYKDVREINATRILEDIGFLPDWIVGSPPCQDASTANTGGNGVCGERTGLFFEAIRLVDEIRPRWACFENVPGIRARGVDRILAEMEALGYACWPLVVGAWHAGAPHKRNRVWIIANDILTESEPLGQSRQPWTEGLGVASDMSVHGCGTGRSRRFDPGNTWEQQQALRENSTAFSADATDTDSAGLWHEPGWIGGKNGADTSLAEDDACNSTSVDGNAGSGSNISLAKLERAVGTDGVAWNGGPTRYLQLAYGLSARLARQCISAYGDAVVPQITEAIARSILRVESAR